MKEMNAFGSNTTKTGVSADGVINTERPMKERTYKYYQDSSFKLLFSDERYQRLFLKEYCKDVDYEHAELESIELQQVFTIDVHNDVCFRADDTLIVLMEHQSKINYNMPMRVLLYVAEEYKRMFANNDGMKVLLRTELYKVPSPVFYVVYTGTERWDVDELKLSDAFRKAGKSFLELTVPVYTKDNSYGILDEYTKFIGMIKDGKAIGKSLQESIRNAISEFSKSNYAIADFLKERNDIMDVLTEQITDEEKEDLRVQAEVEYAVEKTTKEVTKEVTRKAIKESYEMLLDSGISKNKAINIISKKKGMPVVEVENILEV